MSGALSGPFAAIGTATRVVAGVTQSARALGSLLGPKGLGGGPGAGNLKIGSVTLTTWEVPDMISWGTIMGIVEHRFPGGDVWFSQTGPQRKDIEWTGKMLGANAAARARVLDQLCSAGLPVVVLWASMSFKVLIASFTAEYRRENYTGSYSITLKVFPDYRRTAAKAGPVPAVQGGIAGALAGVTSGLNAAASTIGSVIGTAQGIVGGIASVVTPITSALGLHIPGLGQLAVGLSSAQALTSGLTTLASGTAALGNVAGLMQGAGSAIQTGVATSGNALVAYGGAGDLAATAAMAGVHANLAQSGAAIGGGTSMLLDVDAAGAPVGSTDVQPYTLSTTPAATKPPAATYKAPDSFIGSGGTYDATTNTFTMANASLGATKGLTSIAAAPSAATVAGSSPAAVAAGNYTLSSGALFTSAANATATATPSGGSVLLLNGAGATPTVNPTGYTANTSLTFTDGQLSGLAVGP